MRKFFQNLRLWQKIFITGMIPVLAISIILSLTPYRAADQKAGSISENAISDQVKRIDLNLNTRLRMIDTSMASLAKIISTGAPDFTATDDPSALMNLYAQNMMAPFTEIRSVVLAFDSGPIFSTENELSLNMETIRNLMAETSASPDTTFMSNDETGIFEESRASRSFYIYRAIPDESGSGSIGTALFEVSYRMLGVNMLSQQRLQQDQTIFLLNEDRDVIYSDNYLPDNIMSAMVRSYESGTRKGMIRVDDHSYYVYMMYSGTTKWIIASFLPADKLFPQAKAFQEEAELLLTFAILSAAIFLYILSRFILRPVQKLKNAMLSVRQKKLDIYVENDSTDEIGELTKAFNYMVESLKELINQNYRQKIAMQEAEMKALQAQINPHFLYNTLDSINWMLIDRQEFDLSDVIVSLGKLMRYSMQTSRSVVSLREEYDNIRDYLLLQKFRLEDKLDYQLILDSDLEKFEIPKLILQPLVENAILHGIVPHEGPGTILVKTRRSGNFIEITVEDTGKGMTKSELTQYRRLFIRENPRKSIGVTNVVQRLSMYYGKSFSIHVDSVKGKGTRLLLRLPVQKEGDVS